MTPVALHGASMRIRSNGRPSHHPCGAAASPVTSCAVRPSRSRFSRTRRMRSASRSTARPDLISVRSFFLATLIGAASCGGGGTPTPPSDAGADGPAVDAAQALCNPVAQSCPMGERCALRRDVLHRNLAGGETGQRLDADRLRHEHGRADVGRRDRGETGRRELVEIGLARRARQVHAQP